MNTKIVARYLLDQALGLVVMGVALFWSAGRLDWWPAWAAIGVWLAWFAATDMILYRFNPALMVERLQPPTDAKAWDRIILSGLRLTQLARYILAGLDQRYGWTGSFPAAVQVGALITCVLSYALFAWAMAANPFFSQVVRLQAERGHAVAAGGPYRYVRHPAYLGALVFEVAMSTLLASWWAILMGGVGALFFILRTALEDRFLQQELAGYAAYARQVRSRLWPGIW